MEVSMSTFSPETKLRMISGSFYIAKEGGEHAQGDDAHFISAEKQTIGVADGVGGWTKKGVDAGEYARQLVSNFVNELTNSPCYNRCSDLRRILTEAHSKTVVPGSTTFCALTIRNNDINGLNVGDSGFMVIRNREEIYKSPIQTYKFNHPYQLGTVKGCDSSIAEVHKVMVQAGDIVVMGTDGLFDNLYTSDITNLVNMLSGEGVEAEHVARTIAEYAYYNSIDRTSGTPFAEASSNNGTPRWGGKKDDITVIVSFIVSD